jgi:Ca-activated chloride channel homolog
MPATPFKFIGGFVVGPMFVMALIFVMGAAAAAQDAVPSPEKAASADESHVVRITSPLGRTGSVTKVRIVAQIKVPAEVGPAKAWFYVDGTLVGVVEDGPPYSVDWVDDNPFVRREIVVQAQDKNGRNMEDKVVLPPFEITDQSDVTSVLLEAGVYDTHGRIASNLDPSTFAVLENGVRQTADQITRQTLPTTILLLVDGSQSMSRRMDFVRLAAERLGSALRQRDQVIVVPFNQQLGAITGPTSDAPTIAGAIAAMRAKGGTAILDSVQASLKLFDGADGRRTMVLITDGYDENSKTDIQTVLKAAEAQQVSIYVVGIGGVAGISLKGERMLREIADKTGGRIFFPPRESEMLDVSQAVSADLFSRYVISYTPTDQHKDGAWRKIVVEVPGDYVVRTRDGYFAPSPPPIRPTLEFTVMNASHQYLDVAADDLEVVEDGVVQTVETFQEAVEPVSMVMAIDESGSMVRSAEAVRQTARDFVSAVRPEDSLALITFADRPTFAHALGTNRQFTLDAIAKYQPAGGTALYDALYNSLMTLKQVPGRHAVVVLTDGRDEDNPGTGPGSEHTFDEVLTVLKTVNASIFPIGLGARVERNVLEKLAAESGGQAYFPADVSVLEEQYKGIIENLRRRYVINYTSSNAKHDGTWRTVEIRSHIAGLQIATRGGYLAPAQ